MGHLASGKSTILPGLYATTFPRTAIPLAINNRKMFPPFSVGDVIKRVPCIRQDLELLVEDHSAVSKTTISLESRHALGQSGTHELREISASGQSRQSAN